MNPLRYLQLALALALAGAGAYLVWSYQSMSKKVARLPELEADLKALREGYETLSQETIRRDEFDRALRDARSEVSRKLDRATNEDPDSADYLGQRIPQRVRDVYLPAP